jgi:hypothetical protein
MAETKQITELSVVTDSETFYDNIGDIDGGGFDEEWLKKHIKSHGADGLFRKFAWMSFQVFEAMRKVNEENESKMACDAKFNKPHTP